MEDNELKLLTDMLSWELMTLSRQDSVSTSSFTGTSEQETGFGLGSLLLDSLSNASLSIFWTTSSSTGGKCGDMIVVLTNTDDGSTLGEVMSVTLAAVLADMEVVLLATVLLIALVSLQGLLSMFVFHQDLMVEDKFPRFVLLGDVLDTPTKGFFLRWQRNHRFQSPRASEDLRTYSANRYTPRKAVIRVKIHSAG